MLFHNQVLIKEHTKLGANGLFHTTPEYRDNTFMLNATIRNGVINGANLNRHCMVSILLSFPVMADSYIRYLSVPPGYQLRNKKQTKLEILP